MPQRNTAVLEETRKNIPQMYASSFLRASCRDSRFGICQLIISLSSLGLKWIVLGLLNLFHITASAPLLMQVHSGQCRNFRASSKVIKNDNPFHALDKDRVLGWSNSAPSSSSAVRSQGNGRITKGFTTGLLPQINIPELKMLGPMTVYLLRIVRIVIS